MYFLAGETNPIGELVNGETYLYKNLPKINTKLCLAKKFVTIKTSNLNNIL